MRVSTAMIHQAGLTAIQRQTASLLHTQQQVASGRRMLTPADDPVAAARALEVEQAKNTNALYLTNQKAATEALGLVEGRLVAVGELLLRVRTLAVQGGNGALTNADRRSIATELRQRFDELLGLANATDGGGQYLFAGYQADSIPFAGSVEGGVAYAGDDGQRLLQVAASRQVAVSDSGNEVFMRVRNGNGTFVTAVSPANTGSGVIDAGSVAGSFVADTYTISFAPAGGGLAYTVTGVNSGVVASGLYQSGQAIVFNGARVVISGAPAAGDTFQITPATSQSLFATLAGLIQALEAPVGDAADAALLANRLGFALRDLERAAENLLRVRASIGARLNEIETLAAAGEDLDLGYAQALSRLRDVDYAEALTRLAQQQATLEAAQKTYLKVSGLSLFDYV